MNGRLAVHGPLPGQVLRLPVPLQGHRKAPPVVQGLRSAASRLWKCWGRWFLQQMIRMSAFPSFPCSRTTTETSTASPERCLRRPFSWSLCSFCTAMAVLLRPSREAGFNHWADELMQPDYQGLAPDRRLRVNRLLKGFHLRSPVAFGTPSPMWCAVRPRVPPLVRYDAGLLSSVPHRFRFWISQ